MSSLSNNSSYLSLSSAFYGCFFLQDLNQPFDLLFFCLFSSLSVLTLFRFRAASLSAVLRISLIGGSITKLSRFLEILRAKRFMKKHMRNMDIRRHVTATAPFVLFTKPARKLPKPWSSSLSSITATTFYTLMYTPTLSIMRRM